VLLLKGLEGNIIRQEESGPSLNALTSKTGINATDEWLGGVTGPLMDSRPSRSKLGASGVTKPLLSSLGVKVRKPLKT
jgi:hypothetical protein